MQQLCIPKELVYNIFPRIMTKVNVSATVGMSVTVGKCPQQWGNVCNSGEIEYALRNSRLEIAIHNSA